MEIFSFFPRDGLLCSWECKLFCQRRALLPTDEAQKFTTDAGAVAQMKELRCNETETVFPQPPHATLLAHRHTEIDFLRESCCEHRGNATVSESFHNAGSNS